MILKGLNALGECYFIRLTDRKNYYVKLLKQSEKETTYVIEKGIKKACGFTKQAAQEWIEYSGAKNLEMVSAVSVLGNDGTLN